MFVGKHVADEDRLVGNAHGQMGSGRDSGLWGRIYFGDGDVWSLQQIHSN